jgi:hypothetical protein
MRYLQKTINKVREMPIIEIAGVTIPSAIQYEIIRTGKNRFKPTNRGNKRVKASRKRNRIKR